MKNNGLSITAFAVVIVSIVATLATIAFSEGIRKVDWMDLESTALACFGLVILGCVLGWCAFKRPLGKTCAILGTVVVAGFLFVGCQRNSKVVVPSEGSLLVAASGEGKYSVTIKKYDPKQRIAVINTPGWMPVDKPYQFDGEKWIPLWSPYEAPEIEKK